MKTTITGYRFDTNNAREKQLYQELCDRLSTTPGRAPIFDVINVGSKPYVLPSNPVEIELATDFITNNQWNTSDSSKNYPSTRVFDWWENISPNARNYKHGHYLEITPEMIAIRRDTKKCGFCGTHYFLTEQAYCTACIGSEYLQESNLDLLQLLPAGSPGRTERKLSDKDYAELQGLWLEAQTSLRAQKLEKFRLRIKQDHSDAIRKANIEYDGYLKLIQCNAPASEAIFYTHTEKFTFGWRSELDMKTAEAILSKIRKANFPYLVDCKVKGGILSYKPEGYKS